MAGAVFPARLRARLQNTAGSLALLLRGGRLYRNGRLDIGDIGIDREGKLRWGTGLQADEVIDVSGKVVSPGFIDILADNGVCSNGKVLAMSEIRTDNCGLMNSPLQELFGREKVEQLREGQSRVGNRDKDFAYAFIGCGFRRNNSGGIGLTGSL